MTKKAKVSRIENEKTFVIAKRESQCGKNCKSCGGCATEMEIEVENNVNALVGDSVIIGTDTKKVLLAAFLVYILPLIIVFSLCLIFSYYLISPLYTFVLIAFFIGLWFFSIKLFNRRKIESVILEVVDIET